MHTYVLRINILHNNTNIIESYIGILCTFCILYLEDSYI